MIRRWIMYLAAVAGGTVFYLAYREWFSFLLLVGLATLPLAVLLMSLPAMLMLRTEIVCPRHIPLGGEGNVEFQFYCRIPRTEVRGKIRIQNTLTGEQWTNKSGDALPANHCGQLVCSGKRVRVYDYLGLFWFPVRNMKPVTVRVRPEPVAMEHLPELDRYLSGTWKPKPGGGFAENHELRLYRPGDGLNQVHWKLSAKTGKLMIREAMLPVERRLYLNLELRGKAEELDRKLGRLFWAGKELLSRELAHRIRVLTGDGTQVLTVDSERALFAAMDRVLGMPPAAAGTELEPVEAGWQCRIGGQTDEV